MVDYIANYLDDIENRRVRERDNWSCLKVPIPLIKKGGPLH